MNYELKSSIRRNKISLPVKIIAIIVILLAIFRIFFPNLISDIITSIIHPFWNINKEQIQNTNQLSDNAKDIVIEELTKENYSLKEIMGRSISKKVLIAYILKKPPFTAYDSFIIDVGSKNNISKGDKVYVSGNILIGEIYSVMSDISKVKLYSSYGEKYEILIGDKNIQATAIGRGGGSFETVIPRDIKVNEGDNINIPDISNTVFGTVGKITTDPARAFSTIIFSQPINIYEQKWVQIYEKAKSN